MKPFASPLERLALVHMVVILLLVLVLLASTCLGAQYMHRYRKYQLAAAHEDMESLTVSCMSIRKMNQSNVNYWLMRLYVSTLYVFKL